MKRRSAGLTVGMLAACDRPDDQTAGQKLDQAVARTKQIGGVKSVDDRLTIRTNG
jgi:hypothetical protein